MGLRGDGLGSRGWRFGIDDGVSCGYIVSRMRSSLGGRLEHLRKHHGLSASELDSLAGFARGHTRFIERASGDRIAAKTVRQLAAVFGTSMDWLYAGIGPDPASRTVRKSLARAREDHGCATGVTHGA
jgi:Helix-turn-helix domain